MGYGKEIWQKANEELSARRQRAFTDLEKRRRKIYEELPEVKQYEASLTHVGVSAAKAVFAGGDTQAELSKLKTESLKLQEELKTLLASKGYTPKDLEEQYQCPACKDKGAVDGKTCDCLKRLLRDIAYDEINSKSPLPLETSRFDNFDLSFYPDTAINGNNVPRRQMELILKACKNYAYNFGQGSESILMEGGTGLGKTHLSLAIASHVIEKGYGVIYGSAPDLVRMLEKEKFSQNKDNTMQERLESCDLLILDDLGTEFPNSFTKAAIYNLINARLGRSKPTIINTNLTLKEMKMNYTERLVSRLIGENMYLIFFGEDIRLLKKKRQMY